MKDVVLPDYVGRAVRFTAERREHILNHHPEMRDWIDKVGEVLLRPEHVVRSRSDPEAELFYVWQSQTRVGPKYLCVVVVEKPNDTFILTAYLAEAIKKGTILWTRSSGS